MRLKEAEKALEAPESNSAFLVTFSGHDMPGITSELAETLANHQVKVVDIAQAVIHQLLSLSFLFEMPKHLPSTRQEGVIQDLKEKATKLGLQMQHHKWEEHSSYHSDPSRLHHYAVTLIADDLTAKALHKVTQFLALNKMNIDVIKKLSEEKFSCVEILISSEVELDSKNIRKELLAIAKEQSIDIALQKEGLFRRAKRLVVLDIDSTLIQSEVIDELARAKGVYSEVSAITHQAMMGQMNFDESLRLRCKKLEGLSLNDLEKVYQRLQITPGAQDLICVFKKLGYKIALISGGFTFVADRLREALGVDFAYANVLEILDQKLTGNVIPPIVNAQKKSELLESIAQQEKISLDQVIAIGDGANDLLMLEKAGLGIAFNAKPIVQERADLAFSQKNMRSILYLLGLSSKEVNKIIL